jgi:mRNA interferase MazF
MTKYIPKSGDIIWINFDPQAGREESKRRPALVLSPKEYNAKTSLCILCPITSKQKGYPFEVIMQTGSSPSVVLSDHVKSVDWQAREATFKAKVSPKILQEVLEKLSVLLQFKVY